MRGKFSLTRVQPKEQHQFLPPIFQDPAVKFLTSSPGQHLDIRNVNSIKEDCICPTSSSSHATFFVCFSSPSDLRLFSFAWKLFQLEYTEWIFILKNYIRDLISEYFMATERLERDIFSAIFFQSLPWTAWYLFNLSFSSLVYLIEEMGTVSHANSNPSNVVREIPQFQVTLYTGGISSN